MKTNPITEIKTEKKGSKKTAKQSQNDRLSEIRNAIKEIDVKRLSQDIDKEVKVLLDDAACALRDAERLEISKIQKEIILEIDSAVADLNKKSKLIRQRILKMNLTAKGLGMIDTFLTSVVKLLKSI